MHRSTSGVLPDFLTEQLALSVLLSWFFSCFDLPVRLIAYVLLLFSEGVSPTFGVLMLCETRLYVLYLCLVDFSYLWRSIKCYFDPVDDTFGRYSEEYRSLLRRSSAGTRRRVPWTSIPPEAKFLSLHEMESGLGMSDFYFNVRSCDNRFGEYSPSKLLSYEQLKMLVPPGVEVGNGKRVQLDLGAGLKWYIIENDLMYIDGPQQTLYFSLEGYRRVMDRICVFGGSRPASLETVSSAVQRVCSLDAVPLQLKPLVVAAGSLAGVQYNRLVLASNRSVEDLYDTWRFITHYNRLSNHYRSFLVSNPSCVCRMFKWVTLSNAVYIAAGFCAKAGIDSLGSAYGYIFKDTPLALRDKAPSDIPDNDIVKHIPKPPPSGRNGSRTGLVSMLFSPFRWFYTNPTPDTTAYANMYDALRYRLGSTPPTLAPQLVEEMKATARQMASEVSSIMLFDEWLDQTKYSAVKKAKIREIYLTNRHCENRAFVKKESYSTIKRPRAIIDASQSYKNVEGPIIASLEPFFEQFPEVLSGLEVAEWQRTVTLASARFGEDAARFSLDYTSFETCFGREAMEVESYLYSLFLKNFPKLAAKMASVQTGERRVLVYGRKGLVFRRPPFRFSGDQRTYQANTLMNILFIRTAMRLAGVQQDATVTFVSGDDSNLTFSRSEKDKIPAFLQHLSAMGLKVKCAQGTLGTSGFCGFCFDDFSSSNNTRIARDPVMQSLKLYSLPRKLRPSRILRYLSGSAYCMLTQYAADPVMREALVPLAAEATDEQLAVALKDGTFNYWQRHILGKKPARVAELLHNATLTTWSAASSLTGYTVGQLQTLATLLRNVSGSLVNSLKNPKSAALRDAAEERYHRFVDFVRSVDVSSNFARFWYNQTHVPQLYARVVRSFRDIHPILAAREKFSTVGGHIVNFTTGLRDDFVSRYNEADLPTVLPRIYDAGLAHAVRLFNGSRDSLGRIWNSTATLRGRSVSWLYEAQDGLHSFVVDCRQRADSAGLVCRAYLQNGTRTLVRLKDVSIARLSSLDLRARVSQVRDALYHRWRVLKRKSLRLFHSVADWFSSARSSEPVEKCTELVLRTYSSVRDSGLVQRAYAGSKKVVAEAWGFLRDMMSPIVFNLTSVQIKQYVVKNSENETLVEDAQRLNTEVHM